MSRESTCLLCIGLVLTLVGTTSADLVGHWPFDDGAGTTAVDITGSGSDGEIVGAPQWIAGVNGGALQLGGGGDHVIISNSEALKLRGAGGFTVAVWIQVQDLAGGVIIYHGLGCSTWSSWFLGVGGPEPDAARQDGDLVFGTRASNGGGYTSAAAPATANTWVHVAATHDGTTLRLYIDGVEANSMDTPTPWDSNEDLFLGGDPGCGGRNWYTGAIDDLQIHDVVLSEAEIRKVMRGSAALSSDPHPADEATDVPRDVTLGWLPGEFAVTHDVYLGTVFDDVNDASRDDPRGVLASEGQTGTTYKIDGVFAFGQTYYWRVDEVNGAPDNTIFKGDTWSFTVEPLAYPIANVTAASNGTAQPGGDPVNTVNGSGLNENDEHSTGSTDMWLGVPGADPLTIEYEFDAVYKLHEMLVWNYNVQFELLLGFGLKDVTIEYSENGEDWVVLGDVTFNQGTASADYQANTTVAFGGVAAKHIKITVNSGYGMMGQFGLSEVRFLHIPVQAREPQPEDGAVDVSVGAALNWRAGREAVSHEAYLSTDPNALELIDTTSDTTVDLGPLDLAATYHWRIDEVNEAEAISTWEGAVWSFDTEAYIVVEDFESYTDDEGNRIYEIWIDGFGVNDNGSQVGHLEAPFAEQDIVHSGNQSMPLFYDNTGTTISEAERTLEAPMDWTAHGIKALSLMFAGDAGNTPAQLYLKVNGTKVTYGGAAADLQASGWLAWTINVSELGNVGNVTSLVIGIEGAGASGVVYIDDLRLYPQESEMIEPIEPDPAGLAAHYELDSDFQDSSGNGNHAEPVGDAVIASDPVRGSVASLDGLGDGIMVPALGDGTTTEATISVWIKTNLAWASGFFSVYHNNGWAAGDTHMHISNGGFFTAGVNGLPGGNLQSGTLPAVDEWYNVTVTVSASEASLYINGIQEDSRVPEAVPETLTFGEGHLGIWLNGANLERALTGQIDAVRFYNRALSGAEVAGLAGRTTPLYKPF